MGLPSGTNTADDVVEVNEHARLQSRQDIEHEEVHLAVDSNGVTRVDEGRRGPAAPRSADKMQAFGIESGRITFVPRWDCSTSFALRRRHSACYRTAAP